jgi:hypothetical protein
VVTEQIRQSMLPFFLSQQSLIYLDVDKEKMRKNQWE